MRSFIEFGIVAGIVAAVAAALNGCAQQQASFAPIDSGGIASNRSVSRPTVNLERTDYQPSSRVERSSARASLAGYQTAQSGGAQEQPNTSVSDQSSRTELQETDGDDQPSGQPRRRSTIDADSNGPKQTPESDQGDNDRGSKTRRSRRPYTQPSIRENFAEGALASASLSGGYINPQLGREAAESSLVSAGNVSGAPGLAASQPTARQTVASEIGLTGNRLASFNRASSNNVFTAQANPRSGANGACAQLTQSGLGNNQICANNVNRGITGRNFRFTIRRGIRR